MWRVPLFELNYDDRESSAVSNVIASRWLTMGEQIASFENAFSEMIGTDVSSVAISSCTGALHIALLAAGVGPGDEVIIPALTFVADANVVALSGARPSVADCSSLDDWNVSAASIADRITERTRAVIVVHFAGYPCDMDDIVSLCRDKNLVLVEDVAHAPGASYKGRTCGNMGDIGCFSFFTNKNLSVGEGGMLVTSNERFYQQARYYRSHGMTSLTLDRHKGRAVSYDVMQPGLNYRMDEMRAALGLVQLEKLPEANASRGALVKRYRERLEGVDQVQVPFQDLGDVQPAWHIFPVLLGGGVDRLAVMEHLKSAGIQSSIHYPSFRDFTAYKSHDFAPTPIADEVSRRELTLPLFPTMAFDQVDLVVDELCGALLEQGLY